jgi:hypothetical protein
VLERELFFLGKRDLHKLRLCKNLCNKIKFAFILAFLNSVNRIWSKKTQRDEGPIPSVQRRPFVKQMSSFRQRDASPVVRSGLQICGRSAGQQLFVLERELLFSGMRDLHKLRLSIVSKHWIICAIR